MSKGVLFFHNFGFLITSSCNFEKWETQLRKGRPGFDHRKVAKRKFLSSNAQCLKVLSTKISGRQAAREKQFPLLEPGNVLKDYDVHCVQTLEERLEDLDSLSLNFWLTKFVQEVGKGKFI